MVVDDKPYSEQVDGNTRLRVISERVDKKELVWHRDKKDRVVEVIQSDGWEFQMDNQLPIVLEKGKKIEIPKEVYHRVIKGDGDLIIKIIET